MSLFAEGRGACSMESLCNRLDVRCRRLRGGFSAEPYRERRKLVPVTQVIAWRYGQGNCATVPSLQPRPLRTDGARLRPARPAKSRTRASAAEAGAWPGADAADGEDS